MKGFASNNSHKLVYYYKIKMNIYFAEINYRDK